MCLRVCIHFSSIPLGTLFYFAICCVLLFYLQCAVLSLYTNIHQSVRPSITHRDDNSVLITVSICILTIVGLYWNYLYSCYSMLWELTNIWVKLYLILSCRTSYISVHSRKCCLMHKYIQTYVMYVIHIIFLITRTTEPRLSWSEISHNHNMPNKDVWLYNLLTILYDLVLFLMTFYDFYKRAKKKKFFWTYMGEVSGISTRPKPKRIGPTVQFSCAYISASMKVIILK